MTTLFAYHRTHVAGPFLGTFYFTKKKNPRIGDNIYILSGDSSRAPTYFLEGLYVISGFGRSDGQRHELLLRELLRCETLPNLNEQPWFDNKKFHNAFTAGQSMNPVPPEYEDRFYRLLAGPDAASNGGSQLEGDAINDLGTDRPDKTAGATTRYLRDPKVRQAVILRAGGKCEYCGKPGFMSVDGTPYLEAHHIIALAKEGADRTTNVIALCAEDHRRAHFAENREEMEQRMTEILKAVH